MGVGGYPEKHIEAPNLKTDVRQLKAKVDAGADYVVSQMFFDNAAYLDWLQRCRDEGITVPIIPGVKLIDSVRQLSTLPKHFHVSIPDELVDEILASPRHVKEIGRRWGRKQVEGLIERRRRVHPLLRHERRQPGGGDDPGPGLTGSTTSLRRTGAGCTVGAPTSRPHGRGRRGRGRDPESHP